MKDLQQVFDRMQTNKEKLRDLKAILRDALANSTEFQKAKDEADAARGRKKQLEMDIRGGLASEVETIEELSANIQADKLLLNDIALASLTEGQSIKITDKHSNEYEPIFSVTFRKVRT